MTPRIHGRTISLRFLGINNLESSQTRGFRIQVLNHFCSGGGGWEGGGGRGTVSSKEENSEDFCPSYVQEIGLG